MSQTAATHAINLRCSVVVPVYNGARTIQRCLDALAVQTLPADEFEVIVVRNRFDRAAKVVDGIECQLERTSFSAHNQVVTNR